MMMDIQDTFRLDRINQRSWSGFSVEARSLFEEERKVMRHFGRPITNESSRARFNRLASTWELDTLVLSFTNSMIGHPAYLSIIAMGTIALPFIFERMRVQPGFWFAALEAATDENPVRPDSRGNLTAMTQDWLEWANRNGYASAT